MKALPAPAHTNPRGIPQAPFLDSVDEYASTEEDATELLGKLQEMTQKYQFMEAATNSRITGLNDKIPDITKSLEAAKLIAGREDTMRARYELNDTVYAEADIPPTDKVFLWLGANVMLEYPVDEAISMLSERLESANKNLAACREDLEFLRENITTMEVNTARVINWRVGKKKTAAM